METGSFNVFTSQCSCQICRHPSQRWRAGITFSAANSRQGDSKPSNSEDEISFFDYRCCWAVRHVRQNSTIYRGTGPTALGGHSLLGLARLHDATTNLGRVRNPACNSKTLIALGKCYQNLDGCCRSSRSLAGISLDNATSVTYDAGGNQFDGFEIPIASVLIWFYDFTRQKTYSKTDHVLALLRRIASTLLEMRSKQNRCQETKTLSLPSTLAVAAYPQWVELEIPQVFALTVLSQLASLTDAEGQNYIPTLTMLEVRN